MKKIVFILTTIALFISGITVSNVFAESEGKDEVLLSKNAVVLENTLNQWEITLKVEVQPKEVKQDILLLIDTSSSMTKNDRLEHTKKAAITFVDSLLATDSSGVRIGIIDYNSYVNQVIPFTNDKVVLNSAIQLMEPAGATSSQKAIVEATKLLNQSNAPKKSMIFMTDGEPTAGYNFVPDVISELMSNESYWNVFREDVQTSSKDVQLDMDNVDVKNLLEARGANGTLFDNQSQILPLGNGHTPPLLEYEIANIGKQMVNNWEVSYHVNLSELMYLSSLQIKNSGVDVYTASVGVTDYSKNVLTRIATKPDMYFDIASEDQIANVYEKLAKKIIFPYEQMSIKDPMGKGFEAFAINNETIVPTDLLEFNVPVEDFKFNSETLKYEYVYKYKIRSTNDIIEMMKTNQTEFESNGKTTFYYDNNEKDFVVPTIQPTLLRVGVSYFDKNQLVDHENDSTIGSYLLEYNNNLFELRKDQDYVYYIPYAPISTFTAKNNLNIDMFSKAEYKFNDVKVDLTNIIVLEGKLNTLDIIHKKNTPIEESGRLIVNHVDYEGNELTNQIVNTNVVGTNYQTTKLSFAGYSFVRVEGNEQGVYTKEDQIVTYIYHKDEVPKDKGRVLVDYVDIDGKALSAQEIFSGNVGDDYSTAAKTFDGYTLKEIKGTDKGKYTSEDIHVVYVYTKNLEPVLTGRVLVNYVDTDGNTLSAQEIHSGNVGDDYSTAAKIFDGYTLKEVQGDAIGKFVLKDTQVVYVYNKNEVPLVKGRVLADYVDTDGNTLLDQEIMSESVGKPYMTSSKEIDGYTLVEVKGKESGNYIEGDINVVYVYKKNVNPEIIKPVKPVTKEEEKTKTTPKTGVSSNEAITVTLLISSVFVIGGMVVKKKREETNNK